MQTTAPKVSTISPFKNAMEPLVIAEIDRQLTNFPLEVVQSINKTDAIAYTLNRLPPLYSTTKEGWDWQQERAKETFAALISKVAAWGIRAAQRKNKVFPTPLSQVCN
mgnify:CR=1 FL=1